MPHKRGTGRGCRRGSRAHLQRNFPNGNDEDPFFLSCSVVGRAPEVGNQGTEIRTLRCEWNGSRENGRASVFHRFLAEIHAQNHAFLSVITFPGCLLIGEPNARKQTCPPEPLHSNFCRSVSLYSLIYCANSQNGIRETENFAACGRVYSDAVRELLCP